MNYMIKKVKFTGKIVLLLSLLTIQSKAQNRALSIEESYQLARQNYPLIRQRSLIEQAKNFSVENAWKGFLPQFTVQGQATYQSAVTEFRLPVAVPGAEFPTISRDQYKIYGELTQAVYDGGLVKTQVKLHKANALVEEQKLEVELYKVNERVNQVYFGVLVIDEQLKQNSLLKNDIQLGIRKIQAQQGQGTALKSSVNVLKAELMKVEQRNIELQANRKAYLDMLGVLVNMPLGDSTVLTRPQPLLLKTEINRPELSMYNIQNQSLLVQEQLVDVKNRPRLSLFLQGGFGRPALNILNNNFDPYYIAGARLSWSLSGFYTAKNERGLIAGSRQSIELQREVFLYNTNILLKQLNADLQRYQMLLAADNELIVLRESIKVAAAAQLENGIINSSDYLREVNAEDQARQNKILHEIQLLIASYNLQTTLGKPVE
jgi:outer membrane protein TolC